MKWLLWILIISIHLTSTNTGDRSLLYECVLRDVPVEKRMSDWIKDYVLDEAGSSRPDMFNFLIWSAGGTKNYTNREEPLPEVDADEFQVPTSPFQKELHTFKPWCFSYLTLKDDGIFGDIQSFSSRQKS